MNRAANTNMFLTLIRNNYLILLIFLLGLFLRIYDLGSESIWRSYGRKVWSIGREKI